LQENRPTGREFRQNQLPEFATFSLKNLQILDFSQSTKDDRAAETSPATTQVEVDPTGMRSKSYRLL
jgi:hypothetical protein